MDYIYRDIPDNLDRGAQTPETTYRYHRRLNVEHAQGVFLSCANIRSLETIPLLERDLEEPVVSSSQPTTWLALRMVGIQSPIKGFGRLLEEGWRRLPRGL